MKSSFLAFLLLFVLNLAQAAGINGINYDPAHSSDYLLAQAGNKPEQMKQVIQQDLNQMKARGFTVIKTFYSTYCTNEGLCVNITQLAQQAGMQIYLGVYEFPTHADWTKGQVDAAIAAAQAYPNTVLAIVVGNEDAFNWQGKADDVMQERIAADMTTIKTAVNNGRIKIMTAQRQPDWNRLKASDPHGLIAKSDVIAANFYPFWGNSPQIVDGVSVANKIPAQVSALAEQLGKPVVVTEEGWPTAGNNPNTQDQNVRSMNSYFNAWKKRSDNFDSFYFDFYDNNPKIDNYSANDANNFFGLCTYDKRTKQASNFAC